MSIKAHLVLRDTQLVMRCVIDSHEEAVQIMDCDDEDVAILETEDSPAGHGTPGEILVRRKDIVAIMIDSAPEIHLNVN